MKQSIPTTLSKFLDEARQLLGAEWVSVDHSVLADCGLHTLPGPDVPPPAVVYPGSTQDIKQLIELANSCGTPLYPFSTGKSFGLGSKSAVRHGQIAVDLGRRMNRILEINEELGYCVVEPGVTFKAMHEELQRRNSSLMISPTAGPSDGSLLANALEKGGGSGAYGDHFGMLCGMEIVLGNGDVVRTGEGSLNVANTPNWHTTKYSFGPAIDGLFTQSNYGIVSQAGIWLMQRPAAIQLFIFTFPESDSLGEIIELVRKVKAANAVPTLIRVTSDLYLASAQECHPCPQDGALSADKIHDLRAHYGIGAWTVSGALYGASAEALAPAVEKIKSQFLASGKARYIAHADAESMPVFRVALNSNQGIPVDGELNMLKWRPGGGAIWFTPGVPMIGEVANALQADCRKICADNGLDYMMSAVCGWRFGRGVHAILYNRTDEDECKRADRCYRGMSDAFASRGFFVGRAPTVYQDFHQQKRSAEMVRAVSAIKRALDPNNIIAPGRYGIQ